MEFGEGNLTITGWALEIIKRWGIEVGVYITAIGLVSLDGVFCSS